MAVTTGKDTGTTSTGGASGSKSPDSGRGSGGPGGGSLSAPNRTDPSKGATASKAAPSTASGKTDKAPAASTSSKPSNPTGGSLSAPARTAPSSGITSRTPEQQKAVDKAKQNATQYGGAQTSTRAATATKTPSSAKVTDPSRGGITSPMSGQGTSYKTPEAAKKANDKYTDTYGFYNRSVKGMPSATGDIIDKRGQMGPFKGPLEGGMMPDDTFGPFNPNNPYTEQQYQKDWRDYRDKWDSDLRGLKGLEMDDDLRTPQEVREAVQRRMDSGNAHRQKNARESLLSDQPTTEIGRLANEINSLKARIDASRLTPNVPVGPSRGLSGLSSVFTGGNSTLADGSIANSRSVTAPGRTDRQAPQTSAPGKGDRQTPQTTAPGRDDRQTPQTTAPGRTDRQPSPTVTAPGRTDRALTATRSGTDTAWGGGSLTPQQTAAGRSDRQTPQTTAPGRDDRQTPQTSAPGRSDRQTPQTSAPGRTDRAPSPSVTRPSDESFIDSLVNKGDYPGAYNATGSILGMQPTAPSLGQVIARDPMDYTGPRVGTAPYGSAPPTRTMTTDPVGQAVQSEMIAERVVNAMKQAAMAQTQAPTPQSPAPGKVSMPGPVAPSMPDPRLAAMQEQFERIKMARGQIATPQTVAPGRTDPVTPQTTAPGRADAVAPQAPAPGKTDPVTPQTTAPGRTDMVDVGVPQDVPSGPLSSGRPVDDVLQEIALAEAAVNNLGIEEISAPVGPSRAPTEVDIDGYPQSVSPSQDGNYPPDENFMQDAGQPDDLGQLDNRYEYEKERAWEGLKALPERLWNAITSGDIRGFTPETNDKRPEIPPSQRQKKNPAPRMDQSEAVAVARLLALVKLLEQQGTSQQQADLVNSTFI